MKDLSYFPKTDIRFWQTAVFRQPYIIDDQGSAKPFVDVDSPVVGGYNERYTFVDPPIPSEFYAGSVYIGKAFNLETDWQNTFQITSKNTAVAGAIYYLEAGHGNSFALAFTFRVEDLSDQHHYTTIGYPALGTAVFGGAEIHF